MPDMLVKLYDLPPLDPFIEKQHSLGITIRRAIAPEKHLITQWVGEEFSAYWVSETEAAFGNNPPTCFVAEHERDVIGFSVVNATMKGFFGPTGVREIARGKGTGAALLVIALYAMKWDGYGYAIIGGAGPVDFYTKLVGATVIPDSHPGIYKGMLKKPAQQ
ncbi:MAG: GNAT family N-acetyltransferase [Aggregatilineales bacterium]